MMMPEYSTTKYLCKIITNIGKKRNFNKLPKLYKRYSNNFLDACDKCSNLPFVQQSHNRKSPSYTHSFLTFPTNVKNFN